MSFSIRRRRFGQLALASAAATALANLAGKAVAQQSPLPILGVCLSRATNVTDLANTTPAVVVVSSELATGNNLSTTNIAATTVGNLINTANQSANQAVSIQPTERLTGFTSLSDGTLIIASTVNSIKGNFTHLVFTDTQFSSQKSLTVSGLPNNNSTVESLLATQDDTLVAVVSLNGGTPPFKLVTIDHNSGTVNYSNNLGLPQLPAFVRLSNLALSGDGTIYGTTLSPQGVVVLVQLDLNNNIVINLSPLTFNNKPLQNDLRSLAFSPSNQPLALADPNLQGTNSLYSLDVKSGVLKQLRQFAVEQITFARS